MSNPSNPVRDAIIQEDFQFLKGVKAHEVDGRWTVGDYELPYDIGHVMTESEFVRDWLIQFAVGNNYGKNYFDTTGWLKITDGGAQSVMVTNEVGDASFIIPPMLSNNLSVKELTLLKRLNHAIYNIQQDEMRKNLPNASAGIAASVEEGLSSVTRKTITDLIPSHVYDRYKINPVIEQSVYYVRDFINEGSEIKVEDLNKFREILYKVDANPKDKLPESEIDFVKQLTKGQYVFEGEEVKENPEENTKEETKPEKDTYDPFGC